LPQSWLKIYGKSSIARFISLFYELTVEPLKIAKLKKFVPLGDTNGMQLDDMILCLIPLLRDI
jgi:hypothetical protein